LSAQKREMQSGPRFNFDLTLDTEKIFDFEDRKSHTTRKQQQKKVE